MNADGTLSPVDQPRGNSSAYRGGRARDARGAISITRSCPTGHGLDYEVASPTTDIAPLGVEKQSFVTGLYAEGNDERLLRAGGHELRGGPHHLVRGPECRRAVRRQRLRTRAIAAQIAQYHSPYYLLDGAYGTAREAPAPLLIANGFTDDLFPVDEAVRYYNLEHSLYPSDPISLFDGDFGHQRGQQQAGRPGAAVERDPELLRLLPEGSRARQPQSSVTATYRDVPALRSRRAVRTRLRPGPRSTPARSTTARTPAQTISSSAGNPTISGTIDPIAGGGACATVSASDQGAGVATYRLPASTGSGYTLLGSPTVIANLSVTGQYAFIAARLWDVDPFDQHRDARHTRRVPDRLEARPTGSRYSSCIRAPGTSRPATSRSSSCSGRTRRTCEPRMGSSRSR